MALGVPFRSTIAVSVSQNVRAFINTLGFRCVGTGETIWRGVRSL
jgi:hypothetical protein